MGTDGLSPEASGAILSNLIARLTVGIDNSAYPTVIHSRTSAKVHYLLNLSKLFAWDRTRNLMLAVA
jgi:hypothetical protein